MALPVDERREIVLAPATEYQLEIGWSWQVWQPEDPNETAARPRPDRPGWPAPPTCCASRTAPDAGATPAQQDGLNEHVFDARDVGRYLIGVEPANGRATQFTGDPIWAHFDAGHVKQLLEQYGRTLAIEIRRTDPKPQSTPAALDGRARTAAGHAGLAGAAGCDAAGRLPAHPRGAEGGAVPARHRPDGRRQRGGDGAAGARGRLRPQRRRHEDRRPRGGAGHALPHLALCLAGGDARRARLRRHAPPACSCPTT